MSDAAKRNPIPAPKTDDHEDVSWALSTAEATWNRGEHTDALKWLRRAAEAASEAEQDDRALALAKAAAELVTELDANPSKAASVAPSAPPPPQRAAPSAPPSRPATVAQSASMRVAQPRPASYAPPAPATGTFPSAPPPPPPPHSSSPSAPPGLAGSSASATLTASQSRPPPPVPPAPYPLRSKTNPPPRPSSIPRASQLPPRPTAGIRPQGAKVESRGSTMPPSASMSPRPTGVPRPPVAPAPKLEAPRESRSLSLKDTGKTVVDADRTAPHPPPRPVPEAAEDTVMMRRPLPSERPSEPETPESKRALHLQVPKAAKTPSMAGSLAATLNLSATSTEEVDMDAWPTQATTGRNRDALALDDDPKTRIGTPAYNESAYTDERVPPQLDDRAKPSQALRVVVWRGTDGVHIAPYGTTVSAISVDAMLVALDPTADLYAWLGGK